MIKETLNGTEIVLMYTGKYALLKNCTLLDKGNNDGEYCLTAQAVSLLDNHFCSPDDDIIIICDDETILMADQSHYDVVYQEDTQEFNYRDNSIWGIVGRRWSEGYFSEDNDERCSSQRHDHYFMTERIANDNDYYYCDHYQDYLPADEMWSDDDDDNDNVPNGNESYHGMRRMDKRTKEGWSVGFEVEKEDVEMVGVDAGKIHKDTAWCKEKDGSLDDATGYELISPILSLMDTKYITNSITSVKDLINGNYTSSCGGHIHIGHNEYSPDEIFEGLSGYFPLFYAMYEKRMEQTYCKAKKKKEMAYKKDKYSAFYVRDTTVEFRIPSAVKNVSNLLWRLTFMQIICKGFCKSETQVLKDLVNCKSKLHKHLRKVYSAEQILDKANKFVNYSRLYNDFVINNIHPFVVTEQSQEELA
jgi:hypothetical protein